VDVSARWSRRQILSGLGSMGALAACGTHVSGSDAPPPTPTPASSSSPPEATTPESTSTTDPVTAWDPTALERLQAFVAGRATTQFLVVENGETVLSWTSDGAPSTRDVASVQKSVTALLVGRAVQDGLVGIDEAVASYLGPGWTAEESEQSVTVRHLLTMTSGLDDRLRRRAAPGERWYYNTRAYAQLHVLLETLTGSPLDELAERWLFGPIGAEVARFEQRGSAGATLFGPWGLQSDVADLARIGQVALDGGAPLLADRSWLDLALATSQPFNRSYGALWWLNGMDGGLLPGPTAPSFTGPLVPSAPADMVAALGRDDQKLYVVPSQRLVVARLGERAGARTENALSSFDDELWQQIVAARG
jgi:CubicO group peptidase (beta-lactamase class C family)